MNNSWLLLFCFCFVYVISVTVAQDIVGCGGFVQSSVPISFEKVEVKLYTKQGAFKFKTECAPNNGYFLVAVYDKGEYTLKIDPPQGWGFEPKEIDLVIDGKTDACSKGEDLNFKFSGFTLNGKVGSVGRDQGPSGVTVSLVDKDSKVIATNVTDDNGKYMYENIMPGVYTVKASHPSWSMKNDEVKVIVENNNVEIQDQIEVAGYDVKGLVLSSGEPIEGVSFILFSQDDKKKESVLGCKAVPKEVLSGLKENIKETPLCYVLSEKDGSFVFPTVPTGDYVLVPFYIAQNIIFDIVPSKITFPVVYKSVFLKSPFQVYGFTVKGKVLDTAGKGVSDVKVTVTDQDGESRSAVSKVDGTYLIENVTTNHYTFNFDKEHYFFESQQVHITPNTPHISDVQSTKYGVCGQINVFKIPQGVLQVHQHKVFLTLQTDKIVTSALLSTNPDKDGKFCFYTEPGKYELKVHTNDNERQLGFLLQPSTHTLEVTSAPLLGLTFDQFKAKISGVLNCIENCSDLDVFMTPKDSSEKTFAKLHGNGNTTSFTFENVLPGKYKVTPSRKNWCFTPEDIDVIVEESDVKDLKVEHAGYLLKCTISHNISLDFVLENSQENVESFELKQGTNNLRLKLPGTYMLTPKSCYRFEKDVYTYKTCDPQSLTLAVKSYKVIIKVKSIGKQVNDLKIKIKSLATYEESTVEPTYQQNEDKSLHLYEYIHWASLSEQLEITPLSKEILFSPLAQSVTVKENCPGASLSFDGKEGMFIEGSISPPFKNVLVTITTEAHELQEAKVIDVMTDVNGKYRVGPMHDDIKYEVTAVKEGYYITPTIDTKGSFKAQKLGHITVKVMDENEEARSSVLLSLSGGHYRNNNLTLNDGSFTFSNLGPGQYFLKPMQKEYSFEPSSKMVDVSEGEDVVILIKGKRVAFSVSGSVSSLSGLPQEKITIEAVGMHKCTEYQESAKSDENGQYKLRGLQPGCAYNIRMMKNEENSQIERLAPANQVFQIQQEDITNVNFIVFMKPTKFHLTAHIDTELDYLPTLKVLLYDDENLNIPILTIPVGVFKYIEFPPLQPKTYVLKLKSSLSQSTHETQSTMVTVTPNDDLSKKHAKLKFHATPRKIDMEPTQSVIALPFAVAFVFLAYNYDSVLIYLAKINSFIQTFNNKDESEDENEQDSQGRKKKQ